MKDPLLDTLISAVIAMADKSDGRYEQAITLCIGGMMVSGIIISPKEYALSHPYLEAMDESSRRLPPSELEADGFIHLKETFFFLTSDVSIPIDDRQFWRGRIDRIDGYFLGHLKSIKRK